jgi:hypothetical protein
MDIGMKRKKEFDSFLIITFGPNNETCCKDVNKKWMTGRACNTVGYALDSK